MTKPPRFGLKQTCELLDSLVGIMSDKGQLFLLSGVHVLGILMQKSKTRLLFFIGYKNQLKVD